MNAIKVFELLKILPKRPQEVYDRVLTVLETRGDEAFQAKGAYKPRTFAELCVDPQCILGGSIPNLESDPGLIEISRLVRARQVQLVDDSPFARTMDGDDLLGKLCYLLVRSLRPEVVVETGVAYGLTSAYILQALGLNGSGVLHSIDLPPLGKAADEFVGALIPPQLKGRWELHRGVSKRLLPPLLEELGSVDMFVHDSLHTYKTMKMEFELVEPYLSGNAPVIADDVDGNRAFQEWAHIRSAQLTATVREEKKDRLLGISLSRLSLADG